MMAGHPGKNRMYYAMRRRFYWPLMATDIYGLVTRCAQCAQSRFALCKHTAPLELLPAEAALTEVAIDILGPLVTSRAHNRFIFPASPRNADVRVGDYVCTVAKSKLHKLDSPLLGPYMVLYRDEKKFVIQVDDGEERISWDQATTAPRPEGDGPSSQSPHELVCERVNISAPPTTEDEYLIDRLSGLRQVDGEYEAKVRWYGNGRDDDTREPLKELPRNLVIRFLFAKKRHVSRYEWLTPSSCTRR